MIGEWCLESPYKKCLQKKRLVNVLSYWPSTSHSLMGDCVDTAWACPNCGLVLCSPGINSLINCPCVPCVCFLEVYLYMYVLCMSIILQEQQQHIPVSLPIYEAPLRLEPPHILLYLGGQNLGTWICLHAVGTRKCNLSAGHIAIRLEISDGCSSRDPSGHSIDQIIIPNISW